MARPRNSSALDFREYLTTITEELKARIEQQRLATLALLNERGGESPSIAYCPLVDCRPNQRLREASVGARGIGSAGGRGLLDHVHLLGGIALIERFGTGSPPSKSLGSTNCRAVS